MFHKKCLYLLQHHQNLHNEEVPKTKKERTAKMQHPVEEKQKILPHWQTSRHSVCAVHILRLEPWNHENIYDHQRQSMHNETPTQKKKKKLAKEWRIWNWPNIQQLETNSVKKYIKVKPTIQALLRTLQRRRRVEWLKELSYIFYQ